MKKIIFKKFFLFFSCVSQTKCDSEKKIEKTLKKDTRYRTQTNKASAPIFNFMLFSLPSFTSTFFLDLFPYDILVTSPSLPLSLNNEKKRHRPLTVIENRNKFLNDRHSFEVLNYQRSTTPVISNGLQNLYRLAIQNMISQMYKLRITNSNRVLWLNHNAKNTKNNKEI